MYAFFGYIECILLSSEARIGLHELTLSSDTSRYRFASGKDYQLIEHLMRKVPFPLLLHTIYSIYNT